MRGEIFTKLSTDAARGCAPAWCALGLTILLGVLAIAGVAAGAGDGSAADSGGDPRDLLQRAEAGDSWAQLNVGAAFDHGMAGFPLDPVRAVAWYRRAAEAGLAEAQFNLAHCLATGNGVLRDEREALHWMLRAAEQGLASAQFLAGVMFAEGVGTDEDRSQALHWLERAAANGNLDAAGLLERMRREAGR